MIVHLNGRLLDAREAHISPFDRGFLLGDALYEGIRAYDGALFALDRHIRRLSQGLERCRIPYDPADLGSSSADLLDANDLANAFVYWQITRGTPAPDHPVRTRLPVDTLEPTIFGFCVPMPSLADYVEPDATTAATVDDSRWQHGLLKSTSLMGNLIGALDARQTGAIEPIFIRDGLVAEASASNVIIACADGSIATPDLNAVPILAGVTRDILIEDAAATSDRPPIQVRSIPTNELTSAREIMLVGTTATVTVVTTLNGNPVGTGAPGPVAQHMLQRLIANIRAEITPHPQTGASAPCAGPSTRS